MSFRIEEKLYVKIENLFTFKNFLSKKKLTKTFPTRKIESTYFDNINLEMYQDSIEGIVPRKKIRIRKYPETKDNFYYLEKKLSSVEGRFKTRKIITLEDSNKNFRDGILDNQYGICLPKIKVQYFRDYFVFSDVRVSIDTNIFYQNINTDLIIRDERIIVELKTNINKDIDKLYEDFPFQRTRFSKYCYAIETMKRTI